MKLLINTHASSKYQMKTQLCVSCMNVLNRDTLSQCNLKHS